MNFAATIGIISVTVTVSIKISYLLINKSLCFFSVLSFSGSG